MSTPESNAVPDEINAAAAGLGHALESDPPWGLTAAQRWTCSACGYAALRYENNIYGSATTTSCADAIAILAAVLGEGVSR